MLQRKAVFEATLHKQVSIRHLVHLPSFYHRRPRLRWPLMVFLHGAGERGEDLALVRKHGPPKLAQEKPLPFVMLAPQCPTEATWSTMTDGLVALIQDAIKRYRVDPQRVCVTGLSMGGYGAWTLAATRPDLIAAIAPVCGGSNWHQGFPVRALRLGQMPVWAFLGAKDPLVPVGEARQLVALLQALGGPARLTVYPDAGHDSWTKAYQDPSLYRWLLAQRLEPRSSPIAREAQLPDGTTFSYWHTHGAGCVLATQAEGLPRLTPIPKAAWDALCQTPSPLSALRARLRDLLLPDVIAPYIAIVSASQGQPIQTS